jgi:hypothetical protein
LGVKDIIEERITSYISLISQLRIDFPNWVPDDLYTEAQNRSQLAFRGPLYFAQEDNKFKFSHADIDFIVATADLSPEKIERKYREIFSSIDDCLSKVNRIAPSVRPHQVGYTCAIAAITCENKEHEIFAEDWKFAKIAQDRKSGTHYSNGLDHAKKLCERNDF